MNVCEPNVVPDSQSGHDSQSGQRCKANSTQHATLWWALTAGSVSLCCCFALAAGFYLGRADGPTAAQSSLAAALPEIYASSATRADTMAVATGPVSKEAEGVFFLDFITGDLRCLVYYPKAGAFGAKYYTNVAAQLGGGQNNKYLLVTGASNQPSTSGSVRPGGSLVYVTNVTTGAFAAYAIPFDSNLEKRRQSQAGALIPIFVGSVRNFEVRDPRANQPAGIVDPNKR